MEAPCCSHRVANPHVGGPRAFVSERRVQRGALRGRALQVHFAVSNKQGLETFPTDYTVAIRQAQAATQAALKDGCRLIEVEFPTASLTATAGDGEGVNEMTSSLQYLRQFCRSFQANAASVRIFFPDQQELRVATQGKSIDPNAGSWKIDPVFEQTSFKLDYLTRPTGLMDLGIDINKAPVAARVRDTDELFIIAYPYFNVNEMIAVEELYSGTAQPTDRPIIVFNGELDRIRSGYYPALFYPKIGKLAKTFIPKFETAYYIHNFKGARGGVLFRCYPGPWQVLVRNPYNSEEYVVVHTRDSMPTLKEVSLEILPRARV